MKVRIISLSVLYILLFTNSASAVDIFVSIAPQKWIADNLGEGLITTHVLVGKGREPHTFEPTPRQMAKLSRATIYFTVDMEFEHQLVKRLNDSLANLRFINTARLVEKIPINIEDHNGHSDHDKHNESLDPHIWLSPLNLKIMAKEMAGAIIDIDPGNEVRYKENLALFTKKLDALDQRIHQQLAPFAGRTFYVFHPSFGYFAHNYKLNQKAVEVAGKSPSPKQLSQLIAQAKKDNVKIIFVQPQFDTKSGEAIARAIAGEVVPLDPLAEDVGENLEVMMQKIKSALSK